MKPKSFMLIAGEASGDVLAAELVRALREELAEVESIPTADYQPLHASLEARFFGAGGPQMAAAGVALAFDMTAHSVIGLSDALKNYFKFRRLFYQLYQLALERQPDAIICVDFSGFNRRFAHAIRQYTRAHSDWFHDWNPKIIQYVSPQVWASREGRAYQMARDYDAVLSIFPFEKDWYAKRVPQLRVEFVGHPIADRYRAGRGTRGEGRGDKGTPMLLLLPGSRHERTTRHLPVMIGALALIRAQMPDLRVRMVLPNESLVQQAKAHSLPSNLDVQAGGLPESLSEADCGDRLNRHGHDGVRLLRRADRGPLQDVLEHLPNRPAHRESEILAPCRTCWPTRRSSRSSFRTLRAGEHRPRHA